MTAALARMDCCDRLRRAQVAQAGSGLNGIDWLDVLDSEAPPGSPRQRTLLVHLLKPIDAALTALLAGGEAIRIEGGDRQRAHPLWAAPALSPPPEATAAEASFFAALPDAANTIVVRTDTDGDHSPFVLFLQRSLLDPAHPQGFDPQLARVAFSFKVECPQDFDCLIETDCPAPLEAELELDYLARDFEPLRRLVLGRMRALMPGWTTGSLVDLGHVLADLLAYAGDQLSYRLDAIGAEAYLATCRTRTALRRHALLVDYRPSEGSNARTFVQLQLAAGTPAGEIPLTGMTFLSAPERLAGRVPTDPANPRTRDLLARQPRVFEPIDPLGSVSMGVAPASPPKVRIDPLHHRMTFHNWGDRRCCLPAGATSATLVGHLSDLLPGDVLILEEVIGPETGVEADRDLTHRHAVRLTSVVASDNGAPLTDPLPQPTEITEIVWHAEDALPFPLCLSAETADGVFVDEVSVARGNLILADHGETVEKPLAGPVPEGWLMLPREPGDRCDPAPRQVRPARYRPGLDDVPLTHAPTLRDAETELPSAFAPDASAAAMLRPAGAASEPRIALDTADGFWEQRPDLLLSGPAERHFLVEMEGDGQAHLRFGDDFYGARPDAGTQFTAHYRIGSGADGNVGADALLAARTDDSRIVGCRNPLPAQGGVPPESAEQVRRRAPYAFLRQERAVTLVDWAEAAERLAGVQRAAAITRWTGSWRTATILFDLEGGESVTPEFAADSLERLEPLRIATRDLAVGQPRPVTLLLKLLICVADGASRAAVEQGVRRALGSGRLGDGSVGHFHPDRLSFGQPVYLSPILAAARSVAGVASVEPLVFSRADAPDDPLPRLAGRIALGPTEIARLDSNPDFPERGVLELDLRGGR